MIVNGMSRNVEVLEVMGLWGNGTSTNGNTSGGASSAVNNNRLQMQQLLSPKSTGSELDDDDMPGGKSDASFQRRLMFQNLLAAGVSSDAGMGDGGVSAAVSGNKILTARERLQQGGATGGAGTGGNAQAQPNAAIAMAIQQSPEWLRPMLLLLPASKQRTVVLTKPPPHLTEMALAQLIRNALPPERPKDGNSSRISGSKHRLGGGGGDSSDEENGSRGAGGFGSQFRARRARQMMADGQHNGLADSTT